MVVLKHHHATILVAAELTCERGCESKLRLCCICSTALLEIVQPNNRGQEQHIMLLRSGAVLDKLVGNLSRRMQSI
jgi:radical SAM superfamily enzyme with C-terminal helix-hairpin-helix motif